MINVYKWVFFYQVPNYYYFKKWKLHRKIKTLVRVPIWKHFDTSFTNCKHLRRNWTFKDILTVTLLTQYPSEIHFHHSTTLNFRETATEDLFPFLLKTLWCCWVAHRRWGLKFTFLPQLWRLWFLACFLLPAARGTSGPTTTSLISWSLQNWASAAWLLTETAVEDTKGW